MTLDELLDALLVTDLSVRITMVTTVLATLDIDERTTLLRASEAAYLHPSDRALFVLYASRGSDLAAESLADKAARE